MPRCKYNPAELPAHMRDRVRVTESDCWEWTGRISSKGGYGQVYHEKRDRYAHQVSYEYLLCPVLKDHVLDHLCRNRACCNPAHLEPVTHEENVRRGLKGDLMTHCTNGHPWVEENIGVTTNGKGRRQRYCRICNRHYGKLYRDRIRAENATADERSLGASAS